MQREQSNLKFNLWGDPFLNQHSLIDKQLIRKIFLQSRVFEKEEAKQQSQGVHEVDKIFTDFSSTDSNLKLSQKTDGYL